MKPTILRTLLFTGILIPIIFWISTFIASSLFTDYDHFRDTISQLGAIGSPAENFMTVSTWSTTILSIGLIIGLVMVCRQFNLSLIPLIGIFGFTIMFGWAATFHSGNPMHSKSGSVLILLLLGPLLSIFLWKGKEFKTLRKLSWLSFIIMLFILLRAIPSETIRANYTGLIQRFVHFGWSVWFVSLSVTFLKLLKNRLDISVNKN